MTVKMTVEFITRCI